MKIFKKLFLLLPLALSLSLAGCTFGKGSSSSTPSSEPGTSEPSEPEVVVHSLAEVEADIAGALSEAVRQTISFEDTEHGYDAIGLTLSEADAETYIDAAAQEVIAPAVNTLYNFTPDYLTVAASHFFTVEEDFWGDGSTTYVAILVNEDETVEIDIVGYCYNSQLVGEIWVSNGLLLAE